MTDNGCIPSPKRNGAPLLTEQVSLDIEPSHRARAERKTLFSPALIFSLTLTSLLGIAGFIMAAWSTHELKANRDTTISLTSAILVTNPSEIPVGYSVIANMFRGTGYWTQQDPMLYYRSDHGVASTGNGQVYVFGGVSFVDNRTVVVLNNMVRYDVVYNEVLELANMPEPRARFGFVSLGDNIYVIGGVNSTSDTAAGLPTTLVYNIPTNTWSLSPAILNVPRTDSCASVVNGKIYLAGGYDTNFANTDSIEVFDPATNTWTVSPAKLTVPRGDCGAITVNNIMYILGGSSFFQPPGVDCNGDKWFLCYLFVTTVDQFDPSTGIITKKADMRSGRGDFGLALSSAGRILVAGGEYNQSDLGVSRLLAQAWTEEYDIAADYWTSKAPLPQPMMRFGMIQAGGQVYTFGGQPSCPSIDQTNTTDCYVNGLRTIMAFTDLQNYPNVYLLTRNAI